MMESVVSPFAQQISAHIQEQIGPIEFIWKEVVSDQIQVEVNVIVPTTARPYYTLITSGMSDLPMTVPQGLEEFRLAELVICLPGDWPMTPEAFQNDVHYWPIRWLKLLARLPHLHQSWLSVGHTVPNGDPAKPFASNTALCCMLLAPCIGFGDHFPELRIDERRSIHFYNLLPIYREELNYKLKHGFEGLIQKWDLINVTEVVDLNRPNGCLPD